MVSAVINHVNQRHLEHIVRFLFPGKNILINARKDGDIKNPVTGFYLELDIWIPELSISFEFQDPYHYSPTWDSHIPLEVTKASDSWKCEVVVARGETLIQVPYWWDGNEKSLISTVNFIRPDLFSNESTFNQLISLNPFVPYQDGIVPGVGELMLASFPVVKNFSASLSKKDSWWLGEKYDGIRVSWSPVQKSLFTRSGNVIELPIQLEKSFAANFIDGELWFGRGAFVEVQKILHSDLNVTYWSSLRVTGFDDPSSSLMFEKRYTNLLSNVPQNHPFVIVAPRRLCTNKKELTEAVDHIIKDGGEGVILRKPKSPYIHGRSPYLLKVKATRGDKEAMVVKVAEDGACMLKLPDDTLFWVDSANISDDLQLDEGDVVSFSFETFSRNSNPVKPFVFRIRTDLSWEDVVQSFEDETAQQQLLNDSSKKATGTPQYALKSVEKLRSMRLFFEKFAKSNSLDPLSADTWYQVSRKAVLKLEGSKAVLAQYKGSLVKALVDLFPELHLDQSKFAILPQNFWAKVENRRNFFLRLAKVRGIDPLVADGWYSLTPCDVASAKGWKSVLGYYSNQISVALAQLFPELNIIPDSFVSTPYNAYQTINAKRKVFDSFAEHYNFDPLVPANWYPYSKNQLLSFKGVKTVLRMKSNNYSLRRTLPQVYPEVKFMDCHFFFLPGNYWEIEKNRRRFFEDFSRKEGFEVSNTEKWEDPAVLSAVKLVQGYKEATLRKGLHTSLLELFPYINFNFNVSPNYWKNVDKRRQVFLKFAEESGFDPLLADNWYSITPQDFSNKNNIESVLKHYGQSISRALVQLFPTLPWQKDKFAVKQEIQYEKKKNRRIWFDNFANCHQFDPLQPLSWSSFHSEDLLSVSGGEIIMQMFNGNLQDALRDAYPDIRWRNPSVVNYSDQTKRKEFFQNYAAKKGFDYLIAANWYTVTYSKIQEVEGASSVLRYYNNSLPTALCELFPEIKFDLKRFSFTPRNYWKDKDNRKRFFTDFAKSNNFDPMLSTNWYSISALSLINTKGSASLLNIYNGSFVNALIDVFPSVPFSRQLFQNIH